MILNYIKIAWRNMQKQLLSSAINIGGLGIGIATSTLLFLWIYTESTYDHYHEKADHLYRVSSHIKVNANDTWHWATTPLMLGEKLTQTFDDIQTSTRMFVPWDDVSFKIKDKLFSSDKFIYVDGNWFDIFHNGTIDGSISDFKEDVKNIAITQSKAIQLFGQENPIDKIVVLDSIPLVVKAVLADYKANTTFKFDMYVQNGARLSDPKNFENDNTWDNFNYTTFIITDEKADIAALNTKITSLFRELRNDKDKNNALTLQAVKNIHMDPSIQQEGIVAAIDPQVLFIFLIIGLLILITAGINYINLATANMSLRNKEISVKKFIGATKPALFVQFMTESALTCFCAMCLSVILIFLGLPVLESFTEYSFNTDISGLVWKVLAITTCLALLISGIYPSLVMMKMQPNTLIKGGSVVGGSNATFRKILVVSQFTFTMALLISAFILFKQFTYINTKDIGYDKDQIFSFQIPWFMDQDGLKTTRIYDQLTQSSDIKEVTKSNGYIVNFPSTHNGSLDWDGRDKDFNPTVAPMSVANNYQSFYNLKLSQGRWFDSANESDFNNYILNESAVKHFAIEKPILGKKFTYQSRTGEIIAVAKDFHFKSPRENIEPLIFYRGDARQNTISVKSTPKTMTSALKSTQEIWQKNMPDAPFRYRFLDETYASLYNNESKQMKLFYIFGGVVLILSGIGLFGLVIFAARIRLREIGIRKVLGANSRNIVALLAKQFIVLLAIAVVIATPITYFLSDSWLQMYAYHFDINIWVFILPIGVVFILALCIIGVLSLRAAHTDPVITLKSE